MSAFDFSTLVTDRTQADAEALRALLEKAKSGTLTEAERAVLTAPSHKGAYNYTDLNRVTAAMEYLNELLSGYGYMTGYVPIVIDHDSGGGSRLPEGYTELEYIESSGTQYIDTGFKPNQDTRIVCSVEFAISSAVAAWLFGTRTAANSNAFGFLSNKTQYRSDYNTVGSDFPTSTAFTSKFKIDKNKNVTTLNDDLSVSAAYAAFSTPASMAIFANNTNGAISGYCTAKLYSCEIYDNDVLIRNFVPCINPTGEVGLYDLVTKAFFGNAGTGEFIADPISGGNDDHTVLLLHGDTLTDASRSNRAITNYGAAVSDAQSKFDGKSLYFDGNGGITFDAYPFGSGDFTIDWWEYVTSSDSQTRLNSAFWPGASTYGGFYAGYKGTKIYASSKANSWDLVSNADMLSNTINEWVHWAIVRNGTSLKSYRNGSLFASTTISGAIVSSDYPGAIGMQREEDRSYFAGYMEEFRISDVARWTADFTPPTRAYGTLPEQDDLPEEPGDDKDPYRWYENEYPTQTEFQRYLANVAALRGTLILPEDTPAAPSDMGALTHTEANTIESILNIINDYLESMRKISFRAGMDWAVSNGSGFYFIN